MATEAIDVHDPGELATQSPREEIARASEMAPFLLEQAVVRPQDNFCIPPDVRRSIVNAHNLYHLHGLQASLMAVIAINGPDAKKELLWLRLNASTKRDQLAIQFDLDKPVTESSKAILAESLPSDDERPKGLVADPGTIIHLGSAPHCTPHFELPAGLESTHCTFFYNRVGVLTVMNQTRHLGTVVVNVGPVKIPNKKLPPQARTN